VHPDQTVRRIPTGSDARDNDIANRTDQRTGLLQRVLAGPRQKVDRPLHFGWLADYVLHETSGWGHARPSFAMPHGRDLARLHSAKNGEQQPGRIGEKRVTAVRALYETGSRNRFSKVSEGVGLVKPRGLYNRVVIGSPIQGSCKLQLSVR